MAERLTISPAGSHTLLVVGEIDAATAPQLEPTLMGFDGHDGDVVVDMGAVSFIDLSGLRVLIRAQRRVAPGRVIVRTPSRPVRRLLDAVRFDLR